MGSPGDFIHSGTLGGRFSAPVSAATASPPARLPASAPPIRAPPSRRKRRREVGGRTEFVVCFVVMYPPFASNFRPRLHFASTKQLGNWMARSAVREGRPWGPSVQR